MLATQSIVSQSDVFSSTGTNIQDTFDFTTNTSQLQLFSDLPENVSGIDIDYSGLNATGAAQGAEINLSNGNKIIFDNDTLAGLQYNSSSSTIDATLATPLGVSLGTLSFNTSTDADSFTFADGMVIDLPGITGDETVTDPGNSIAPLTVLSDYLSDLDDPLTTAQLSADNFAYLNPTGTAYTVTPESTLANGSGTGAIVTYVIGYTPGAVVTGETSADIDVGGVLTPVPATNVLVINTEADNNISQDSISNVQTLDATGNVELTSAQFNAFSAITLTGGSGDIIEITTGGTDSLAKVTGTVTDFAATGWDGTTLIGNNDAGQLLEASLFGNDTLRAGSGTADQLIAGEGVDTLVVESWLAAALLNSMQTASAF